MRAVVFERYGEAAEVRDVPDPEPAEHGVVVRVEATGLCRSDWHGWQGHDPDITLPHVPGHELAGVVEAMGARVTRWRPGDRVTVPFIVRSGVLRPDLLVTSTITLDEVPAALAAMGAAPGAGATVIRPWS
ncbi:D-arabinose 1-dehydrogenase-like Zn-dependent alcohol dehydrogenase [Streptomyces sp. AK010]|nr:D-arabinose 1-dehydrogenase-like Zn-dependent alcohol dehydrogenase [Streptomyces sp. AK010]